VPSFEGAFAALFDAQFPRLFRLLDRLSGEPDLAADLAQEAFIRLYRRAAMPDVPQAWLVTVALNLFRNARSSRSRHRRLLGVARSEQAQADPAPAPDHAVLADEARRVVRLALDRLPERERRLLLLRAEGYSYREMAAALGLHEASVGVLLARARRAFRAAYEGGCDAS
jgi:RNA polymerase sigma-70 factor (ECF subfamily)